MKCGILFMKGGILSKMVHSIAAGILISMGCIANIMAENRTTGAFIFAFGLLIICSSGQYLFTGSLPYLIYKSNLQVKERIIYAVVIYIGNLIGTILVAMGVIFTRYGAKIAEACDRIVDQKMADNPISLMFLGMMCTISICSGVIIYGFTEKDRPVVGVVALVMGVMVFILSGYEHCVADMFYIVMYGKFDIWAILVLLFVTIGNVIGGVITSYVMKDQIRRTP